MFHPAVLLLLQQAGGLLGIQTGGVPNACTPTDALNKDIVTAHNDFRTSLTQGQYGPGSKSVFALTYSCENEGYAMTILTEDCKRNKKDLTSQGVSDNFFTHYLSGVTQLDDADVAEFYPFAVDKWANTLETNLNSQALYEDEGAAEFANMANYKALKVGCTHKFCPGTKLGKVAIACVYSAIPKLGEPLYTPVANGKGCTADTTCKKVIKESICQTDATTGTKGPLCETNATEVATTAASTGTSTSTVPTSTTVTSVANTTTVTSTKVATTSITTTSTQAATTTKGEEMTDEIRNKIVTMHNDYRRALAKGQVRNGAAGNPNCPTAKNMLTMRYDNALETEAQAYANTCPTNGSDLATRPESGENFEALASTTTPYLDAFTQTLTTWWEQILINGVNNQMKYTQYLESKAKAPIKFTQMGWADSYKVGCGIKRCASSTVIVCRYNPRGNIYSQYIYNSGTLCASCSVCNDGLCPTPA